LNGDTSAPVLSAPPQQSMDLSSTAFDERVATREAQVGIVGLGYAGLPLAMVFAEAGFHVTGIDLNEKRVRAVQERRSYLVDVPAERYHHSEGRLRAASDYTAVQELDALTICVPTPLSKTRTPDISYVVAAAESVAANLRPGQLVVLQSTTYPGTTEEIVLPILERSGGRVGEDFFLGYAPERVDPGNKHYSIRNTPKLVGGVTPECLRRTELLYRQVIDHVVPVSSPMVAETAKLHENTFRAVNIALANELALMCDRLGISAWEVIEAASSKPFGFLPHYPGPGLGGDCIPVVPHFLAWRLREYGYSAQLIDAAHGPCRAARSGCAERHGQADPRLPAAPARDGLQGGRARHARITQPRGAAPARAARRRRSLLRSLGSDGSGRRRGAPQRGLVARRGARRRLRRRTHPAPQLPRNAAVGRGTADRGHA
jgi:nucleotide sugar dehydrogenase